MKIHKCLFQMEEAFYVLSYINQNSDIGGMMKKACIGLTPSHNTDTHDISMRPTYLRAITAAGGVPVVLPLEAPREDFRQLVEALDGFLFTGGPDIHPFLFGEQTLAHCGNVSPARDEAELALLSLVMSARKPLLGICRGIQTINIGLGGTIYQDIPSQLQKSSSFPIAHQQPFYYHLPAHRVDIQPDTQLFRIAKAPIIQVNSMHHQSVKDVAPGLVVSGYAPDGVIEAIEKPDYPYLLAVQWHPEYLWEKDPVAQNIFKAFVDASGEIKKA